MKKFYLLIFLLAGLADAQGQDSVTRLYPGKAPGSESWDWPEGVSDSNLTRARILYNVTDPTLTLFRPAPGQANGTAIIIAPGGGFRMLSINSEGFEVARWLVAKGVTCFVLKYRVMHSPDNDPVKDFINALKDPVRNDSLKAAFLPLAIADAQKALDYVRSHASDYNIRPGRIGFMGFSAGGAITMGLTIQAKTGSGPNFIAPVYGYWPPGMAGGVPQAKTPAFLVAASDDPLVPPAQSIAIYNRWTEARQSAEIHIYAKGGHGFGMKKQHIPVDTWIDRFGDWLLLMGYVKKAD